MTIKEITPEAIAIELIGSDNRLLSWASDLVRSYGVQERIRALVQGATEICPMCAEGNAAGYDSKTGWMHDYTARGSTLGKWSGKHGCHAFKLWDLTGLTDIGGQ